MRKTAGDTKCLNCAVGRWQFDNDMIGIICSYCKEPMRSRTYDRPRKIKPFSFKKESAIMKRALYHAADWIQDIVGSEDKTCYFCPLIDKPKCVKGEPSRTKCRNAMYNNFKDKGIMK